MTKYVTDLNDLVYVTTECGYVPQQSNSKENRYVFFYTVTIHNNSSQACQLMSRHWSIQDANRKVEEVYGEGVIGEQPIIQPGELYKYTSGAVLETEIGTMEGRYFMVQKSIEKEVVEFEINIPKFTLSIPRTLH
jgi:ApaG protein